MKISLETIQFYKENGHVLLKKLINDEEILNIRQQIRDEVYLSAPSLAEDQYYKTFLFDINLWERNDEIKKFIFNKYLAKIAAELMGVTKVRILNDAAYFKKPHNLETKWHYDLDFYPLNTSKLITAWIPLISLPRDMGSMKFISKSQKMTYSDKSIKKIMKQVIIEGLEEKNYGAMNIGDVTFHSGLTLHSAAANTSNFTREVITITYYSEDANIIDPGNHDTKKFHLNRFFPGLQPGDKAVTQLNPIVYG
ncbi:phytanoyl-CoA dioxygenase family protein [Bacillus sp. 166amftsu]|uniref:phytanoyl-CoA dioxygenase family protein n=1 Tax=Bacillus sp. 166amftsu TaxID=1761753 RepID=UPI0008949B10|nr:phytanoyl-CoA dioxygenase family protein [Bacillus sp. 166amftsu]SDZ40425.1 Phytanoyl-CoA dioxygenase (PhyH) [Bacillus sp. 166amftsu]